MKKQKDRQKNSLNSSLKNTALFVVATTLLVLIAIVIVLVFFYQYYLNVNNIYNEGDAVSNDLITNIDQYFDTVAAIANDANYNYYLQEFLIRVVDTWKQENYLRQEYNVEKKTLSNELFSQYLNDRTDISSILVFAKNQLLLNKSIYDTWTYVTDYTSLPWYEEAVNSPSDYIISGPEQHPFLLGNNEKTISVSKAIRSSVENKILGVFLIDINLNEITRMCESAFNNRYTSLFVFNDKGEQILNFNPLLQEQKIEFSQTNENIVKKALNANKTRFSVKLDGRHYLCTVNFSYKPGWYFITFFPLEELLEEQLSYIIPLFTGLFLILIITIFILNRELTSIIFPITMLTQKMDSIENFNTQLVVGNIYHDERGKLIESFNQMIKRIDNLNKQIILEQEEKRKYELQVLYSQINPHFLYNTLDTIIWMAEAQDDNIVEVTKSLATFFRLSLNSGQQFISVSEEIEQVKNYLFIQNFRYGEKISYSIDVSENVKDFKILKLIVQPFVENSIYHGIKPSLKKGNISIKVRKVQNTIEISVLDDGVGMNSKKCKDILKESFKITGTAGSGIGIKNVQKRIQLYYGSNFGISYDSKEGQGTKAVIKLLAEGDIEYENK